MTELLLGEAVRLWAKRRPSATAVSCYATQRSLTYGELNARANRLADSLRRLGAGHGDRVAYLSDNRLELVELFVAAAKAGVVLVALNNRLSQAELDYIASNCEPTVLLFSDDYAPAAGKAEAAWGLSRALAFGDDYEALLAAASAREPNVEVDPDDPFFLLYTSGTTGQPKGAISTHGNHVASIFNVSVQYFDIGPEDVALNMLPMYFSAPIMGTTLPFLYLGRPMAIVDGFDPELVMSIIDRDRVTCTQMVPIMIQRILDSGEVARYDISSLRRLGYGSAPIPPSRLEEAIETFGRIFVQGYGSTETMYAVWLPPWEHVPGSPRLASAGRELLNAEARVVREDGTDVEPGEVGEVLLRGPAVSDGYWGMPEESDAAFRDGWFHIGDLARLDEDSFLYVVDRKKDLIISGGMNVYPKEIENALMTHPRVEECAVVGVPDEEWGESVKAVVVTRGDGAELTEQEIIDHCRERLASYKKPRSVEFWPELPRTATGKVLRREIRERYWEGLDRRV